MRPGFPERGGFADLFKDILRRLASLERPPRQLVSPNYDPNTPGGEGWALSADGSANFLGQLNVGSNVVPQALFIRSDDNHLGLVEIDEVNTDVWVVEVAGGSLRIKLQDLTGPTETVMLTIEQDGTITIPQGEISFGAPDSGGAGFRLLRVPNV